MFVESVKLSKGDRGGYLEDSVTIDGHCIEGYKGKACSECEDGWGKYGSKNERLRLI